MKRLNRSLLLLTIPLLAIALVGCSPARAASTSHTRAFAACVDSTPSYSFTGQAQSFIGRLILNETVLRPGDRLYARWLVDERTGGVASIIASVEIPVVSANPWSGSKEQQKAEARKIRLQAAQKIQRAKPPQDATATNVMDCVARGAELLRGSRASSQTLVLFSDLQDNLALPVSPDLSSIRVLCVMCQSDRPDGRIAEFGKRLEAYGAISFEAFDPQVTPSQILVAIKE